MINYPNPIPLNEVDTYVKLAKAGNIPARQALILRNGRLVLHLAILYCRKHHLSEEIRDELVQEGLASIPHAIKKYDFNDDCTFVSYMTFWIYNAFVKYMISTRNLVHVPINVIESERNQRIGKGKVKSRLKDIEYYRNMTVTSSESKDEDNVIHDLFDTIPANPEYPIINFNDYGIKGREANILDLIYNVGLSLEEIKGTYGISKERIRQISNSALAKIGNQIKSDYVFNGELLTEARRENCSSGIKEYYIKIESGRFIRKLLMKGGVHREFWKDTEGNTFKNAYGIPKSHFHPSELKRIFEFIINKLKKSSINYEAKLTGTSDSWYVNFDCYFISLFEYQHKFYIHFTSLYGDLDKDKYSYDEIPEFKDKVKKVIVGLR